MVTNQGEGRCWHTGAFLLVPPHLISRDPPGNDRGFVETAYMFIHNLGKSTDEWVKFNVQ